MGTAADIRGAVPEAPRGDPLIDPDDIVVEVMGGDVLVNWTVPSAAPATVAGAGGVLTGTSDIVALGTEPACG